MSRLPAGIGSWGPKGLVPSVPVLVGSEPPRADVQPGEVGEEWLIAVQDFASSTFRGVLWDATIETITDRARQLGGNSISISAPMTSTVMRIIGTPIPGAYDDAGDQLYDLPNANRLELILGSTFDGRARRRYVVRDQVSIDKGRVRINGVGIVGGLTSDRTIGAPTRLNLIGGGGPGSNASFEQGELNGWRIRGDAEVDFGSGGPDGGTYLRVRGTPGQGWVERRVSYSQPVRPWGRQRIAGQALVRLPEVPGTDDYGLVTIAVFEGGQQVWPDARRGDPYAGVVQSDMPRGGWMPDHVVGIGYLPTPPYTADVYLRLHPVDETAWTDFDDTSVFRRENTSTVTAKDLVYHPALLFAHAQGYRDKSSWGVEVEEGELTGIVEVGTWWHEDGQSMNDALEALCGRGLDVWDLPGPGRRVKAAKRQGSVRTDLVIAPWSILGTAKWSIDPGAQRTALRAVSAAGSAWGGADEGAIAAETSQATDPWPVIDVNLQAPVGMTPNQLRTWLAGQLSSMKMLPTGTVLLLPWDLGIRLEVGDTVRVAAQQMNGALLDWMRITERAPDPNRRLVAVTTGSDVEMGGGR